ncbi:MAG TPA: LCP family protein [Pseudoneobacillus sp.]|nr:LCP family protein [Pseudoneobacillus sp.]
MSLERRALKLQKKKKGRKKWIYWIVAPLIFVLLAGGAYATYLYNKAETAMSNSYKPLDRKSTKRVKEVSPELDNITVLFAGVDESKKRNAPGLRTDALMLATFNQKQKSVKLLSIPRDSYVYIPSKGYEDKITHAYGKGGISSTIDTVEGLLDIPVDYYVKMNFEAFIDVVESLGGVDVNVTKNIDEMDSKDRHHAIILHPGFQTLNGEEALAYARTRKIDSDIERGKRQQEILKAIVSKASSAKSVTKYAKVIEAIGENMETDLSFDEMKSFLDYAVGGNNLNIESLSLKGSDSRISGIYYYQLDQTSLEEVKSTLKTQLEFGKVDNSNANTTTTANSNS